MHRNAVAFVIADDLAKIIEVDSQVLVIIIQIEKFYSSLRYEFFQTGKKYFFFFNEMNIQMFTDILPGFQHQSIVACRNSSPVPVFFKPFEEAEKIVAGYTESRMFIEELAYG